MKFVIAYWLLLLFNAPALARVGKSENESTHTYIVSMRKNKPNNPSVAFGVLFKVNMRNPKADAKQTAQFQSVLNGGFVVTFAGGDGMTESERNKALQDIVDTPQVEGVWEDEEIYATVQTTNWGLDRIDQHATTGDGKYDPFSPTGCDASSVTAYVIDTGIRKTHEEFEGRAEYGYNFVDNKDNADDCQGHGTHVAGIIGGVNTGVASNVNLVAVKVLDCNGKGDASNVISAIDYVINNRSGDCVINMSLGSKLYAPINQAVQEAYDAGITVAVAAGNEEQDACQFSPGSSSGAFNVGSTTSSDSRSSFSNWGPCVDIFAPGSYINSSYYTGNDVYETLSGTSMAAPHLAGAVACYLGEKPGSTPAQVESDLINMTTSGVLTSLKNGSPNKLLYIGESTMSTTTTPITTTTTTPPTTTTTTPAKTTTTTTPTTTTTTTTTPPTTTTTTTTTPPTKTTTTTTTPPTKTTTTTTTPPTTTTKKTTTPSPRRPPRATTTTTTTTGRPPRDRVCSSAYCGSFKKRDLCNDVRCCKWKGSRRYGICKATKQK